MTGVGMMVLSVVVCVSGFFLNRAYSKKYREAAVQWKPFVLQTISVGGVMTQLGYEVSSQLLCWTAAVLLAFGIGFRKCWQHAVRQQAKPGDIVMALAAQVLLPLGVAVFGMMLFGLLIIGLFWVH